MADMPRTLPRNPSSADNRLPGLDILRGLAALWVFWFHASWIVLERPGAGGKGYLAVDFFFMLSGFVMARTYEHRFATGLSPLRFMVLRYRRLWPVMAIGVMIGAPMAAIEIADPARFLPIALANVLLVPVFTGAIFYPLNSAAWSVMAELVANLLHVTGLWRMSARALMAMAALLAPLLVWICLAWGNLSVGAAIVNGYTGIIIAVFGYAVGIVMWRCWRDEPPLRIPPWLTIAALPAVLFVAEAFAIESYWFDLAFVFGIAPLLLMGGLGIRFGGSAAQWLGALSFPLYAVNLPLLHWAHGLAIPPLIGVTVPLAVATWLAWRTTPALAAASRSSPRDIVLQA